MYVSKKKILHIIYNSFFFISANVFFFISKRKGDSAQQDLGQSPETYYNTKAHKPQGMDPTYYTAYGPNQAAQP